jgi:ligand-binding sensor protein
MWRITLPPVVMETQWDDGGFFDDDTGEWVEVREPYTYQTNIGLWYAKVEYGRFDECVKFNRDGECVVCFKDDYSSPIRAVDTAWKKRNDALAHYREVKGVGEEKKFRIRRAKEEQTIE